MIYLIDDEKIRQEQNSAWDSEMFNCWKDIIVPVYNFDNILSIGVDEFLKEGNVVLIHSSFKDFNHIFKVDEFKFKLQKFADENNSDFSLVEFSGGQPTRLLSQNKLFLPFEIFYRNLLCFLNHFREKDFNLNYLQFGENPLIEEQLNELIEIRNVQTEKVKFDEGSSRNFILKTFEIEVNEPFLHSITEDFYQEDVTDEDLQEGVSKWLTTTEYDNLFIPICLGATLCDFNGLRLATYIRCTDTINRLKPIFIYSFVDYSYLLDNEYFNILKTKNIFLIDYSAKSFIDALSKAKSQLTTENLMKEIRKLNLSVPKNIGDSHSIANKWAIYRWSQTIDTDEVSEILQNKKNISSNLYFKYLQTIYPISSTGSISEESLKIKSSIKPKILYIDDDADGGWSEIFCKIILEENKMDFHYIGDELKSKSEDEIIDLSLSKIIDEEFDIVILDFRLHRNDIIEKDVKKITGFRILEKIKKHNSGIQVIIFSATNKIWNLEVLQEFADGFILKENAENSSDSEYTKNNILYFVNILEGRSNMIFLKRFYKDYDDIQTLLLPRKKVKNLNPLPKEFVDEVLKWLLLSNDIVSKGKCDDDKIMSSFLFKFSVLENLANRIIDVDNPIKDDFENKNGRNFKFQFRKSDRRLKNFVEDEEKHGYYRRSKSVFKSFRNLPWSIKILNALDFISEEKLGEEQLNLVIKKRNDFIHSNTTTGDKAKVDFEDIIFLHDLIIKGLKNVV